MTDLPGALMPARLQFAFAVSFHFLFPAITFSLLTGFGVVCGYALLGAVWIIMKAEGSLQQHALRMAKWLGTATLIAIMQ